MSRSEDRRRRAFLRAGLIAVGALLLAGAALVAFSMTRSPTRARTTPTPAKPAPPPRPTFAFAFPTLDVAHMGKAKGQSQAHDVAAQIQTALSGFYDKAFVDPVAWAHGAPDVVWSIFSPDVQDRARADAASLTIGTTGLRLATLSLTRAELTVTVLVDPSGNPVGATAEVQLRGQGTLVGGQGVSLTNHTTFLFREDSGTWQAVGYPVASTSVDAGTSSPAPTPSASSGASP